MNCDGREKYELLGKLRIMFCKGEIRIISYIREKYEL